MRIKPYVCTLDLFRVIRTLHTYMHTSVKGDTHIYEVCVSHERLVYGVQTYGPYMMSTEQRIPKPGVVTVSGVKLP